MSREASMIAMFEKQVIVVLVSPLPLPFSPPPRIPFSAFQLALNTYDTV